MIKKLFVEPSLFIPTPIK